MIRRSRRRKPVFVTDYHVEMVRIYSQRELQGQIADRTGLSVSTIARIQKQYDFDHFTRAEGRSLSREIQKRKHPYEHAPKDKNLHTTG